MKISQLLGIEKGSVVAVIGTGGKSSLIEALAAEVAELRPGHGIVVSPTTRMYPPLKPNVPHMGVLDDKTGKLTALPPEELAALIPEYDLVLLEADGSRGKPAKAWGAHEPVIPDHCTHTVGIFPVTALGMPATAENIHRLPEFLELTGLRESEPVTETALLRMLFDARGMFKNAAGRRFLLANRADEADAMPILTRIKSEYPDKYEKLLYGSVFSGDWRED